MAVASSEDRELIYRCRHAVYARELGQHHENSEGRLTDALDMHNHYLCAWIDGVLAGFVSITPPGGAYSVDKYVDRAALPFPVDDRLYEVRLLTVMPAARRRELAMLLMYSALRWIESRGGTRIVAIGRREVLGMYTKAGFAGTGLVVASGAVTFEVMHATVARLRERAAFFDPMITRIEAHTAWDLDIAFRRPAPCFHGGTFFEVIGTRFDDLNRRHGCINADVLDAWFPPSPKVIDAINAHLPWLLRTSPPNRCDGMIAAIAEARGVSPDNILPGAGSSDLIFLALTRWLNRASRVLLLDPTYGEYAHVLERVIGCTVERFPLERTAGYAPDLEQLAQAVSRGHDLLVIVNPNSPTGHHLSKTALEGVLAGVPAGTRVWVDETYIEYVGSAHSIEPLAAASDNVVVCKSMSKVYALSGARAAYLCAPAHVLEDLRALTPPWAVSLLGQVAAVEALRDPSYYSARYAETHQLRRELARHLSDCGWDVVDGCANFVLAHLPDDGPDAAAVVARARSQGVFIRDVSSMGRAFGGRAVRVAVKDAAGIARIGEVLRGAVAQA